MLKPYLKDNKMSLAKLTQTFANVQVAPTILKPFCHIEWNQPAEQFTAMKSPTHKRRKIFQRLPSPQNCNSGEFAQLPTASFVEPYKIESFQVEREVITDNRTIKKKMKTNKQNGLCLAKANCHDSKKQIQHKSLNLLPSSQDILMPQSNEHQSLLKIGETQRQKRITLIESQNRQLQNTIKANDILSLSNQSNSLVIDEAMQQTFTFNSNSSSLRYSPSKYWVSLQRELPSNSKPMQITSPFQIN